MPQKVILDTDIGDDIDDALALALICASPELQLVGITTVYGNVVARARQARTLLKVAGERFARIPVCAGCGASMASRNNRAAALYLENQLPNQDSSCLPECDLSPLDPRHAVSFLIETLMNDNGDIVPITIGAMTNLAAAMVLERRIIAKIPRVVAMAAEFKQPFDEWNIRCDPEAARIVFDSGIRIDVTPFDIGHTVSFEPRHLEMLRNSSRPLAQRLTSAITLWQNYHRQGAADPMPSLFDPMAVATMIRPELCTWKTGVVHVELQGEQTYAHTTLQENPQAPHRIAWTADRDVCLQFYLDRVLKL